MFVLLLFQHPHSFAAAGEGLPVGQLLLVGFKGTEISEGLEEVIKESRPGGILLFSRNVRSAEQVAIMNRGAQEASLKVSGSPLLVAIDQEGGNVIRIKHSPSLPSALALSRAGDIALARRSGAATGKLLRSLGINVNLAPVVDVSDPERDAFLGTRSFGSDPAVVSSMATAIAQGLQASMVMPIAKHFPGHGDASGDSHLMAASNPSTIEALKARDLVPYFSLSKRLERPWGVMLAHVRFPEVDPSGVPATFSAPIVQGLLRNGVGKKVLVITDDIEMAGAGVEMRPGERAVRAIAAGADMVMIAWSRKIQREVLSALTSALASGRLKPSRVREALSHIQAAKKTYAIDPLALAPIPKLASAINNSEFTRVGDAVLAALTKNHLARVPASNNDGFEARESSPKLVATADPIFILSARRDFFEGFRRTAKGFEVRLLQMHPKTRDQIESTLRAHPESPVFVYVSGHQVADFVSDLPADLTSRMVLVNIETKAALKNASQFKDIFESYYRHPKLGAYVAKTFLSLEP